ncbi:tyrosine-type recombinase/integrase [Streptomyces sp. NPDC000880]
MIRVTGDAVQCNTACESASRKWSRRRSCSIATRDRPHTTSADTRHSRLTHAAEKGASTPVLMKLSGHTSLRSLAKYARVSDEGLLNSQGRHRSRRASPSPAVGRIVCGRRGT